MIDGNFVYLLGSFGHLTCADLETGVMLWRINILEQFSGDPELVWGTCSSPLIVDGKLIVNPGGPAGSVVALDPLTAKPAWESPGDRHAYSSFIVATLGGVRQLVGYDRVSLGGWDIATGRRLWTLKPPIDGDFNVPTPVAVNGRLLVTSENNFTRLYDFDASGNISPRPVAVNEELAPDISSPIIVGQRAFCVSGQMYCLDVSNDLRPIWTSDDKAFGDYAALIASDDRILAIGIGGELLLIDALADEFNVVSRLNVFPNSKASQTQLLGYPALVGSRLYLRGENELVCLDLDSPQATTSTP
jgi:outer membrane protein assembly factor BamB